MPIDDQQFAATAGVFLKHLNRMFELAVQDMDHFRSLGYVV